MSVQSSLPPLLLLLLPVGTTVVPLPLLLPPDEPLPVLPPLVVLPLELLLELPPLLLTLTPRAEAGFAIRVEASAARVRDRKRPRFMSRRPFNNVFNQES